MGLPSVLEYILRDNCVSTCCVYAPSMGGKTADRHLDEVAPPCHFKLF